MEEKYFVGVDLGGTFIKAGIVDKNGNIICDDKIETKPELGVLAVIDSVCVVVNNHPCIVYIVLINDLLFLNIETLESELDHIFLEAKKRKDTEQGNAATHKGAIAERFQRKFGGEMRICKLGDTASFYHDVVKLVCIGEIVFNRCKDIAPTSLEYSEIDFICGIGNVVADDLVVILGAIVLEYVFEIEVFLMGLDGFVCEKALVNTDDKERGNADFFAVEIGPDAFFELVDFPEVGDNVLGAGGGTAGFCELHRATGQNQGVHNGFGGIGITGGDLIRHSNNVSNGFFDHSNDVFTVVFADGIVCDFPVNDADVFSQDISEAGGLQLGGRICENVGVRNDNGGLAAIVGDFEIVFDQRSGVGCKAVHRGRGGEDGEGFVCLGGCIAANIVDGAGTDGENTVKILGILHNFLGGGNVCVAHIGINLELVFKTGERIQDTVGNADCIFIGYDVDFFREITICENFADLMYKTSVCFVDLEIKRMLSAAGAVFKTFKNCLKIHDKNPF